MKNETRKRISEKLIGHPVSKCAKYWELKSPDGIYYSIKNLNNFIREYSHLFNADDVRWSGSNCRASKGLRNLFALKKDGKPKVWSWKGWRMALCMPNVGGKYEIIRP